MDTFWFDNSDHTSGPQYMYEHMAALVCFVYVSFCMMEPVSFVGCAPYSSELFPPQPITDKLHFILHIVNTHINWIICCRHKTCWHTILKVKQNWIWNICSFHEICWEVSWMQMDACCGKQLVYLIIVFDISVQFYCIFLNVKWIYTWAWQSFSWFLSEERRMLMCAAHNFFADLAWLD